MIPDWTFRHRWRVWRHVRRLRRSTSVLSADVWDRELAKSTGCLPVYADMGGTLLLSPSGEITCFDHGTDEIGPANDAGWESIARMFAAERFPDLADIRPVRPSEAVDCPNCGGTGRATQFKILCGNCNATGWTAG